MYVSQIIMMQLKLYSDGYHLYLNKTERIKAKKNR